MNQASLARLNSLVRRLRKEPSILKEYNQVFEDQLCERIIERVDEREEQPPENTHCLRHQAVIRSDALTTKLRVVFDASARLSGEGGGEGAVGGVSGRGGRNCVFVARRGYIGI